MSQKNELATVGNQITFEFEGVKLAENGMGMEFDKDLPIEQWLKIGPQLGRVREVSKFFIGDWLNAGERKYGEKYSQGYFGDDKARHTIEDYAWVARSVETSRRSRLLSFSHHREVAKLEPQQQQTWLKLAEDNELEVRELRHSIKEGKVVRIVDIEAKSPNAEKGLTTLEGIMLFLNKWVKEVEKKQPIEEWSEERRKLVKEELQFVVEFWRKL